MKKSVKWIALLLAVVLLSLPFLLRLQSDRKQLQENETALREQWAYCLKASDWIYGKMLWAFQYTDAYTKENTWDNLLKARAACSAAKLSLEQVEFQGPELTQEQYLLLMRQGIEAEAVLSQFDQLEMERQQNLYTLTCLEALLLEDVYLAPTAQKLSAWIENCTRTLGLESQYLRLTTNYLFLQMGDRQWGEVPEQYPVIFSSCGSWSKDPEQLQADCAIVVDAFEELLNGSTMYVGISEYGLTLVQQALEGKDISPHLQSISGVPAYFPDPGWSWDDASYSHLFLDPDTQEMRMPQPGEALTQAPEVCYIQCQGVSLEQVQEYEQLLNALDIESFGDWDEEDQSYSILAKSGESLMMVKWSQEETVLYLKKPIACLMPLLYYEAMQTQQQSS